MKLKCWDCEAVLEIDLDLEWFNSRGYYSKEKLNPPKKPWKRFYCEGCGEDAKQKHEEDKQKYIILKTKMLLERAIKILEAQKMDIYKYEEAIKAVKEFAIENPDKFDSSYEMIAAMILINERIKIKTQQKVGKYRADFCLPDHKCIVEIDGERHSEKLMEDSNRDIKIRQILGPDWEVVRVPTEYLEENAKMLKKAIFELKKLKQKTRKENGGILPKTFSKRDKEKANEVQKIANR